MDVGLREGGQAGNAGKNPDNFCRNSLSPTKNPHFLLIVFKKVWRYMERSQALDIRFKRRADVNKFAFLHRDPLCMCEQMSQL